MIDKNLAKGMLLGTVSRFNNDTDKDDATTKNYLRGFIHALLICLEVDIKVRDKIQNYIIAYNNIPIDYVEKILKEQEEVNNVVY